MQFSLRMIEQPRWRRFGTGPPRRRRRRHCASGNAARANRLTLQPSETSVLVG